MIRGAPPPSDFVKNPAGYLYRAAINEATNTLRGRERQKLVNVNIDSVEIAVPGPDVEPDERIARLRAALTKMKPNLIEVLNLYYKEEYDVRFNGPDGSKEKEGIQQQDGQKTEHYLT